MATAKTERTSEFTPDQIRRAALELPLEDRENLTQELFKSVEEERTDIERLWLDVVRARLQEYREGKTDTIPHEEVMRILDDDLAAIDAERKS